MPSTYAHYRFGVALLPQMPGDVRRTIQRFRRLFDAGLHGPDIFYYQIPVAGSGPRFLGIRYHEQTGRECFQRCCRAARLERSEALQAYLYGVLCHYCLDSHLHPLVSRSLSENGPSHQRIEAEFDRFLLERDGKVPPCSQDLSPHLKLTPGEWETVAKCYPPATARTVRDSLQNMARLTKLMAAPEGARRTLVGKSISLLDRDLSEIMIPTTPGPRCAALNEKLLAGYEAAAEAFPEMLSQLQAHMTYSASFEADFNVPFG